MAALRETGNAAAVQLFKHLPWLGSVWAKTHRFVEAEDVPWAALARPLRECAVALVTTAGVHLRSQPPFDMDDPEGDPSFRAIPADTDIRDLTITHKYYDHSAADRDINVVFPLERLRELRAEGVIGGISTPCYSFMGHIDGRHLSTLIGITAPAVARQLRLAGADCAFLTPA